MNLQELSAAVVNLTARRDFDTFSGGDGSIQQAIQAATLFLHGLDYFYKDLGSTLVIFDQAAYLQTLDAPLIPRFKKLKYARKWDPSLETSQENPTILPPLFNSVYAVNIVESLAFFKPLEPDEIFDNYGYNSELQNVCYQLGDTLMFKSSSSFAQMLFGYYKFPNVDISNNGANFESWIARDHPFGIVYHATSTIFSSIGKLDASRKFDSPMPSNGRGQPGLVQQEIDNILKAGIEIQGR